MGEIEVPPLCVGGLLGRTSTHFQSTKQEVRILITPPFEPLLNPLFINNNNYYCASLGFCYHAWSP